MSNFEIMKNLQKEVFLRLNLLCKMVLQREPNIETEEEKLFKMINSELLSKPDIVLLKEQNLFYLVAAIEPE